MGIRVLIGDPDRELLAVFQSYLAGKGFQVSGTDDEQHCLRELCESAPDVLVLELDLARCWGQHVIAALQDGSEVPDVPVIALTHGGARTPELFPDGPIRAYLDKPFSMGQLVESIHDVVASPA